MTLRCSKTEPWEGEKFLTAYVCQVSPRQVHIYGFNRKKSSVFSKELSLKGGKLAKSGELGIIELFSKSVNVLRPKGVFPKGVNQIHTPPHM